MLVIVLLSVGLPKVEMSVFVEIMVFILFPLFVIMVQNYCFDLAGSAAQPLQVWGLSKDTKGDFITK